MSADDDLDAHVRRVDEARWLASRFAPADARARLTALYAFNHEIARVREAVSDPLVGEIRLAWWREAIGEVYDDPARARRHPVVQALGRAIADAPAPPPRAQLEALIDPRMRDLDAAGFAGLADVAGYAAATAGGLMTLAGRLLGDDGRMDAALAAAGRCWGLAGLARAFPAHAATGWVALPAPPPSGELARVLAARDAAAARGYVAPLVAAAGEALAEARAGLKQAPAELWPGYGYLALAPGYLRALTAADADPFRLAARRPGLLDRARLVLAAARGRV